MCARYALEDQRLGACMPDSCPTVNDCALLTVILHFSCLVKRNDLRHGPFHQVAVLVLRFDGNVVFSPQVLDIASHKRVLAGAHNRSPRHKRVREYHRFSTQLKFRGAQDSGYPRLCVKSHTITISEVQQSPQAFLAEVADTKLIVSVMVAGEVSYIPRYGSGFQEVLS